jgi:hypothetical protein
MHSLIDLADFRRQDLLADAVRERLAQQARPTRPLASPYLEILRNAVRTVSSSARSALDAFSFHWLKSSNKKGEQAILTVVR